MGNFAARKLAACAGKHGQKITELGVQGASAAVAAFGFMNYQFDGNICQRIRSKNRSRGGPR
jgi:hypothetical protein